MDRNELIKIPIEDLLSHLGHEPAKRTKGGTQLMYHSPLREDRTPSFSVSTQLNLWNDLGMNKGGNVIDLAIALNNNCTFSVAASWLEEKYREMGYGDNCAAESIKPIAYKNPKRPDVSEIHSINVVTLVHHALLSYLMSRGISINVAIKHCNEVHYIIGNREYFALGFPNIIGGIEIRNVYFKGCYGSKAPSIIHIEKHKRTDACCVFEGFMDFLSYLTLQESGDMNLIQPFPCDCIVLNSTNIVHKAMKFIKVYQQAYCYLDNDNAGKTAFNEINKAMDGNAIDCSVYYVEYNDLNDYLRGRKRRR